MTSNCPPRPSSSRPAGSAPTTKWCAATGRERSAPRRRQMVTGVPAHVDGRMLDIAADCRRAPGQPGPHVALHRGHHNWNPIWPDHGIRILPGPSSMWFDALGRRLPAAVPARLRHPRHAALPADHARHRTSTTTRGSSSPRRSSRRSSRCRARSRTPTSPPRARRRSCASACSARARPGRSKRSRPHGADFVVANNLDELVGRR